MDINVNIRGFLEIHVWICYGFSVLGKRKERGANIGATQLAPKTHSVGYKRHNST